MFAVADFNSLSAGFSYGQPIHPLQPPFHKIPENFGGDVIRHLYNQEWPVICVGPPPPPWMAGEAMQTVDTGLPPASLPNIPSRLA